MYGLSLFDIIMFSCVRMFTPPPAMILNLASAAALSSVATFAEIDLCGVIAFVGRRQVEVKSKRKKKILTEKSRSISLQIKNENKTTN